MLKIFLLNVWQVPSPLILIDFYQISESQMIMSMFHLSSLIFRSRFQSFDNMRLIFACIHTMMKILSTGSVYRYLSTLLSLFGFFVLIFCIDVSVFVTWSHILFYLWRSGNFVWNSVHTIWMNWMYFWYSFIVSMAFVCFLQLLEVAVFPFLLHWFTRFWIIL